MGERRVETEVSSRRVAAVVLVVAVSIGELNGTGSPGAFVKKINRNSIKLQEFRITHGRSLTPMFPICHCIVA